MTSGRLALPASWLGLFCLLLAVGWWWLVFQQVVDNSYLTTRQALPCLVGSSDTCTLAQALCKAHHPLGIKYYYAGLFWVGLGVLGAGLLLGTRGPAHEPP